jgi:asparagine N-glycosylation enzyme membrane subunit Stt3
MNAISSIRLIQGLNLPFPGYFIRYENISAYLPVLHRVSAAVVIVVLPCENLIENRIRSLSMRKDQVILVLVGIVVVVLLIAAFVFPLYAGATHAEITSVSTDKDLYHSNEVMKIVISLQSPGEGQNATVVIKGIEDRNGKMRLEHTLAVPASPGPAVLIYDYNLPSCSHCAGLDEGTYQFDVAIVKDGAVLSNKTHSVQIAQ